MNYFVYVHSCPNGKKYVGITRQIPKKRWNNGYGYVKNEHFSRAIKKYGWENIDHMIIEVDTENEMYYLERYLIAYYNSNNPDYGYNNSSGGESGSYGVVPSKETIEKRKETIIEKGAEIEFSERKPALSVYSATAGKKRRFIRPRPEQQRKNRPEQDVFPCFGRSYPVAVRR